MERTKCVSNRTHGARREAVRAFLETRKTSIERAQPYARRSLCALARFRKRKRGIRSDIHPLVDPMKMEIQSDEKAASRPGQSTQGNAGRNKKRMTEIRDVSYKRSRSSRDRDVASSGYLRFVAFGRTVVCFARHEHDERTPRVGRRKKRNKHVLVRVASDARRLDRLHG